MRPARAAAQEKGPCSGAQIRTRCADEDAGIVMVAKMREVVSVGQVDDRGGPESRAIDQGAVGADQSDGIDLREGLPPADQITVDIFGPHDAPQLFRVVGIPGHDLGLDLLQNKIDRLHRARGLLGQGGTEVGDLAPIACDRLFAAIPNREPGSNYRNADQDNPGKGKAAAWSGPALGPVDVMHHPYFQCAGLDPTTTSRAAGVSAFIKTKIGKEMITSTMRDHRSQIGYNRAGWRSPSDQGSKSMSLTLEEANRVLAGA